MKKLNGRYDWDSVAKMFDTLVKDYGYIIYNVSEGTLGYGDWICVPSEETSYVTIYIVKETYLNCWSSDYSVFWKNELEDEDLEMIDNNIGEWVA